MFKNRISVNPALSLQHERRFRMKRGVIPGCMPQQRQQTSGGDLELCIHSQLTICCIVLHPIWKSENKNKKKMQKNLN